MNPTMYPEWAVVALMLLSAALSFLGGWVLRSSSAKEDAAAREYQMQVRRVRGAWVRHGRAVVLVEPHSDSHDG